MDTERDAQQEEHKKRNWVGTIVALLMLTLAGLFVARVFNYAQAIQSGELVVEDLDFFSSFSTSAALASTPLPDGDFDLRTTDDPAFGNANAKVQIVEFADFGCPYSRASSLVIRKLAQKYPSQVRFVYRDFPITELHPVAQRAAEAGECAQDQGKFWEYHDKLYQNQTGLTDDDLFLYAEQVNLEMDLFVDCMESERYREEVLEDYNDGYEAGVRGTPTFFINGNRIPGAIPESILDAIIQATIEGDAL